VPALKTEPDEEPRDRPLDPARSSRKRPISSYSTASRPLGSAQE